MPCTCRVAARCSVCNASVRVPLSNMESSSGAATIIDRFARRESAASREGLRRLIQGSCSCPSCGHTVFHTHSRSCVAEYLASAGVSAADRELLLAKVTFPEG